MDYRDRFRSLRKQYKLEQEDVAKICNVTKQTVSSWETCRRDMAIDCIVALCNYYKVSCNYILGLPEYPPPSKKF